MTTPFIPVSKEMYYYKEQLLLTTLNALNRVINYQRGSYNGEAYKKSKDAGSYPFIPMFTERVLNDFIKLKNTVTGALDDIPKESLSRINSIRKIWRENLNLNGERSFIDAGCGIGNIMLLARATDLCYHIHGIEYFHDTYEKAINWLGVEGAGSYEHYKIFKEDILNFDRYGDYDIIYYYRPFENPKLQNTFETLVEDSMKVGSILIPRLKKRAWEIRKDKRFMSIFEKDGSLEPMYIKVSN